MKFTFFLIFLDALDNPDLVLSLKNASDNDADLSDNNGSSNISEVRKDNVPVQVGNNGSTSESKSTMNAHTNSSAAMDKPREQLPVMNLELPIVNIPNVNLTVEYQTTVLPYLSMMNTRQQNMCTRLDNLEKYLCDKEVVSTN